MNKDNVLRNYDIPHAVYKAIRDECDCLCRHCRATADDFMTMDDEGTYYHSNKSICNASAIRRIWAVMQQATK